MITLHKLIINLETLIDIDKLVENKDATYDKLITMLPEGSLVHKNNGKDDWLFMSEVIERSIEFKLKNKLKDMLNEVADEIESELNCSKKVINIKTW